jgi:hypothetical protein
VARQPLAILESAGLRGIGSCASTPPAAPSFSHSAAILERLALGIDFPELLKAGCFGGSNRVWVAAESGANQQSFGKVAG